MCPSALNNFKTIRIFVLLFTMNDSEQFKLKNSQKPIIYVQSINSIIHRNIKTMDKKFIRIKILSNCLSFERIIYISEIILHEYLNSDIFPVEKDNFLETYQRIKCFITIFIILLKY